MTNTNQNFASKIPCYSFEHVPTRLASGGVGLFIDGNLKYTVLEKESHGAFQASWIAISFNKQNNVICGILDCQHNSPDCFSGYVSDTTQKVASTGKSIYLMSDFNFLFALQSSYLLPTIGKPTRMHGMSASPIDDIFVNNPDQVLISGNIITDVSDHFSQFCILTSGIEKVANKTTKKRDFSDISVRFSNDLPIADWDNIILTLEHTPWDTVFVFDEIDDMLESWENLFNNAVDQHCPWRNKRVALVNQTPWMSNAIIDQLRLRDTLLKRSKRSNNPDDWAEYKRARNKAVGMLKSAKRKYYIKT
ncbi:unnamed protein product [Pocillopora meandrina]|uniref:Uncharacterized protein n=1 Tax=Pocillopora meandrina TaxID=46732 RepID=A0AAU9W383_9CNID|nr:unnamed protein product [Pocillopora meandrina]